MYNSLKRLMALERNVRDLHRKLANIAVPGTIRDVDHSRGTVRVEMAADRTAWVPWLTTRAGDDRTWHPPVQGEACIVISPSGEIHNGFAIGSFYRDRFPALGDEGIDVTQYSDGARIGYERSRSQAVVKIPGRIVIEAPGGIEIKTPLITVMGNIAADCVSSGCG